MSSIAGCCSLREWWLTSGWGNGVGVQGLVVIGDELLSGMVEDVNGRFLCRELHALGWRTSRVGGPPTPAPSIAGSWLHPVTTFTGVVCRMQPGSPCGEPWYIYFGWGACSGGVSRPCRCAGGRRAGRGGGDRGGGSRGVGGV